MIQHNRALIIFVLTLGLFSANVVKSQTPPATPSPAAPPPTQTNTPPKTAPPTATAPAAAATPAAAVVQPKPVAKPTPKPVDVNPNLVKKMRQDSQTRYNIWFSDQLKTNYSSFPYKKSFMVWPRVYEINRMAIPICKEEFKSVCGSEDYPLAERFIFCLQENYEKFKANANCSLLAHYLVHTNFNRHVAVTTEPCKSKYDACVKSSPKGKSPAECMMAQEDLPPLCVKMMADSLKLRSFAANFYDQRFLCTTPESCK